MEEIGTKRRSTDYADMNMFDEPPKKLKTEENQNGIAAKVASHYNKIEEKGIAARTESRIYFLRNFNNWIKSNLIAEFLEKVRAKKEPIYVLDLGCGKGGDLLKWRKGEIRRLVGVDVANVSVEQAKERYETLRKQNKGNIFSAEFHCVDCCKDSIMNHIRDKSTLFDLASCQFVYNYSFDKFSRAESMLANACRFLKPGGFFIGTMPNANEIMKRLKMSDNDEFGNDVFRVKMTSPVNWPAQGGRFLSSETPGVVPIFGAEYNFSLEEVVDCPEYLVHFGTFKKMAERHGMKLVYAKRFPDYAKQVLEFDPQSRALMERMSALECYPPQDDKTLVGKDTNDYVHADEHIMKLLAAQEEKESQAEGAEGEGKQKLSEMDPESEEVKKQKWRKRVGTLSKAEWDAVTLYMVFAFQRVG